MDTGFAKVRLVDLKTAVAEIGIELSLHWGTIHRDTNRLFMTVVAKKSGLLSSHELVGSFHDLEWCFIDLDISPNALVLLKKWAIPFELSARGY